MAEIIISDQELYDEGLINDDITSITKTYSSSKIQVELDKKSNKIPNWVTNDILVKDANWHPISSWKKIWELAPATHTHNSDTVTLSTVNFWWVLNDDVDTIQRLADFIDDWTWVAWISIPDKINYPDVKNDTWVLISKWTPVMASGSDWTYTTITPAIADWSILPLLYVWITTEDIDDWVVWKVCYFGKVENIDTSIYSFWDILYISPTNPWEFTITKPISPDYAIFAWLVTKSATAENWGRIFVRHESIQEALDTSYDNTDSWLTATNVKNALDELQQTKADISLLTSNITLYPTTTTWDFGYNKMVTETTDPDYDDIAIDVPTWLITWNWQLIAWLIADAWLFIGNPWIINIPTIWNIAKIGGNSQQYAEFYFEIYHRDNVWTETLMATSNTTWAINPFDTSYYQFSASALLNDWTWVDTDRIVIKYYANLLWLTWPEYHFQFGWDNPVRTELPVPVSLIISNEASWVLVDTTNFDWNLWSWDNTVQKALDTLDDISIGAWATDKAINQAAHWFSLLDSVYHNWTSWQKAQTNNSLTLWTHIITDISDLDNFVITQSWYKTINWHWLTPWEYYYTSEIVTWWLDINESTLSNPMVYVVNANDIIVLWFRPSWGGTGWSVDWWTY